MALPREIALLLDHARAEAKRRDHAQVVLAHLAAVLMRRNRERFTSTFGVEALETIETILKGQPPRRGSFSDAPELQELMAKLAAAPNAPQSSIPSSAMLTTPLRSQRAPPVAASA